MKAPTGIGGRAGWIGAEGLDVSFATYKRNVARQKIASGQIVHWEETKIMTKRRVDRRGKQKEDLKRKSHSMKMQRPAISHQRNGRYTDRNESAAETSFLNWKDEEVITADFINREIVGFG